MPRNSPNAVSDSAERSVLEFMGQSGYRPIAQRELLHRMHVHRDDRPAVRRLLREMLEDGRIRKLRGGKLVAGSRAGRRPGKPARDKREVRRPRLGVFRSQGAAGYVQPFDPGESDPVHIPGAFRHGAKDLHAVHYETTSSRADRRSARGSTVGAGRVLEDLGHIDHPGTDLLVVKRKYELAGEFPGPALEQAAALPSRIGARQAAGRERFDDPSPVTIDGETAKDFDDAIAVRELPRGGFRLDVHIADVAHFVPEASPLDLEALRRGTSVYFPGDVVPMFPEKLSNDLCSLRPRVERLVQSVVIEFSARGEPKKIRFADGVIRSAARLTYTQVARVLEGESRVRGVPAAVVPMLHGAERLRRVLERRRHARGSIDFDLPEPQILLDVEGAMTGITIEPRNRAHLLIEEFMLAANEAVATHMSRRGLPCMYRVHDEPDPLKLENLAEFVKGFGLDLGDRSGDADSLRIQSLIEAVEGRPEARVVGQVALRSMKQARYSPSNSGHFGLAAPMYCHFTSPIRRYPDLVVHRLLRSARGGERSQAGVGDADLEQVAESSSALERNAESAERELLVWKKVTYIADRLGASFDGVATGVTRFGLFVQLVDNLVEGLVRVEELGPEYFEFSESGFTLTGTRTGRTFRLGDKLRVKVVRVDRILLRVDMVLDDAAGQSEVRRRAGQPGRGRTDRKRRRPPRNRSGRRR